MSKKNQKNQPGIKDLFAKASETNARNNNENSLPVEEENNFTEYETKNRGSASRIHQPKGGPPLDFINIQPPKRGSVSRIYQPKGVSL